MVDLLVFILSIVSLFVLYWIFFGERKLKKKMEEKRTCIVIHGCPPKDRRKEKDYTSPDKSHWIPWIKSKLEKNEIKTFVPKMPVPWKPDYNKFKKEFEKYEVNKNTILIGHSCGGTFLVRWLGETKKKIKKLILIAPTKILKEKDKYLEKLYDFNIDKNIRNLTDEIIIFISNDREERVKSAELFKEELNGKLIRLENKGHFCIWDMKTEEFPELLKEILR